MSLNDYFMSKIPDRTTRRKPQFVAKTWYPIPFCCLYKIPLEPILKIIFALIFAAIDLSGSSNWTVLDSKGELSPRNVWLFQHATVFFMFAILAVAEIMESSRKVQFPHAIPHIILSMNFFAVGLVYFQNHSSKHLVMIGHSQLLIVVSILASLITAVESFQNKTFALSYAKCFFTMLQGTWLFQASLATSGSTAWKESPGSIKLIPLTFLWHLSALLIFSFVLHFIILCAVNQYKKNQDAIYNGHDSHRKVNEDSIPLGIVVNGNMLYEDDTSDIDTLYP